MINEGTPRSTDDIKDMMIAGYHVRLTYRRTVGAHWTVSASLKCGIGEKADDQALVTKVFDSREAAEHDAIQQVTALLGHNTDRSNSRVRNWR
jgi:hypothetical protein